MSRSTIVIERDLIRSSAFRTISSTAKDVMFEFLCKRKMENLGTAKRQNWNIMNNGNITFPYSEAEKKGFSISAFKRAIHKLREHGFLDISKYSEAHAPTLYSISERWKNFGTKSFIPADFNHCKHFKESSDDE